MSTLDVNGTNSCYMRNRSFMMWEDFCCLAWLRRLFPRGGVNPWLMHPASRQATIEASSMLRCRSIPWRRCWPIIRWKSPRDQRSLVAARDSLQAGTEVFVVALPNDSSEQLVAAAARLTREGLVPVPHVVARNIASLKAAD